MTEQNGKDVSKVSFGENLKKTRKLRGYTQEKAAQKIGISRSYYADLEGDRYDPSIGTVKAISDAFGVLSSALIEGENIEFKNLFKKCMEKEITLEALAKILEIPDHQIERIKTNKMPNILTLSKLADYFDCTYDYLIGRTFSPDDAIIEGSVVSFPSSGEPQGLIKRIPILGTVAAGQPLYAEQNIIDYEEVPDTLIRSGEYFYLIVKGDSMIGSRIHSGDKVLIRKQSMVENGQIALVLVNGDEATLKRIKFVNGTAILYPDNPAYEPMVYPSDVVQIIGYVVQVCFDPNNKKNI